MNKKKIVILGSTGSIGKKTFNLIKKDKKKFELKLLSTNANVSEVIKQAKELNVKNVIICNYKKFILANKKYHKLKIKFHNSFSVINKLFKKKELYYSMIAIVGLDGLKPAIDITKYSKNLAIVNKESIVCGWSFLKKEINKNKVNFIPIDSEHFSIYSLLSNRNESIYKIFITASGGPFLNKPLDNIKINDALKHPNWKMGKKISIDSSTLMNKVFEVIEAKKIFNTPYKDISILTHPKSYVHAIIMFKNALTKILLHTPNMNIPIINSLYQPMKKNIKLDKLDISSLNNLNLKSVNKKKFPLTKLLDNLSEDDTLYETVLITINDYFVHKFLKNEIDYKDMINQIYKCSNLDYFLKYNRIKPKKLSDIYELKNYVSFKLDKISV